MRSDSSISPAQKLRCLEVMDELSSFSSFSCFAHAVDPVLDGCPDYLQRIQTPMDLEKVRAALEAGGYATVTDWKADLNLVWANALQYNPPNSLVNLAAQHLQQACARLTATVSDSERADWAAEFRATQSRIHRLVSDAPPGPPRPPGGARARAPAPAPAHSGAPAAERKTAKRPPAVAKKNRRAAKVAPPPSPSPSPSPSPPPSPETRGLTPEQEAELVAVVNALEDEDDIREVMALIGKMEPDLAAEDEMDITIGDLALKTRAALWDLVQKFIAG
jgi:hypothetical protein